MILPRIALLELAADILAVTLLMHASGGIQSGIGGLLVVFVGAASLTLRGRQAFFAAAVAALAVLAEQAVSVLEPDRAQRRVPGRRACSAPSSS